MEHRISLLKMLACLAFLGFSFRNSELCFTEGVWVYQLNQLEMELILEHILSTSIAYDPYPVSQGLIAPGL